MLSNRITLLSTGGIIFSLNFKVKFNSQIFFYLILPPIIFAAGYTLKKKKFFRYLKEICLYGIIGTLINFSLIGLAAYYFPIIFVSKDMINPIKITWNEALLLSSVLSASDEVAAISFIKQKDFPKLGALVFGEGIINDALSIVLFQSLLLVYNDAAMSDESKANSMNGFVSILSLFWSVLWQITASCLIGLTCGLGNARILKVFSFSRRYPVHQMTMIMSTGILLSCFIH